MTVDSSVDLISVSVVASVLVVRSRLRQVVRVETLHELESARKGLLDDDAWVHRDALEGARTRSLLEDLGRRRCLVRFCERGRFVHHGEARVHGDALEGACVRPLLELLAIFLSALGAGLGSADLCC